MQKYQFYLTECKNFIEKFTWFCFGFRHLFHHRFRLQCLGWWGRRRGGYCKCGWARGSWRTILGHRSPLRLNSCSSMSVEHLQEKLNDSKHNRQLEKSQSTQVNRKKNHNLFFKIFEYQSKKYVAFKFLEFQEQLFLTLF